MQPTAMDIVRRTVVAHARLEFRRRDGAQARHCRDLVSCGHLLYAPFTRQHQLNTGICSNRRPFTPHERLQSWTGGRTPLIPATSAKL